MIDQGMGYLLITFGFLLAGGLAALFSFRSPIKAIRFGVAGAVAGSLTGLWPVWNALVGGVPSTLRLPWNVPGGELYLRLDALSAFFLLPVFVLTILAAIYGGQYMRGYQDRKSMGSHWFFFNMFILGMTLVLLARQALLFLVAWEVMSLAAFFLVTFDHVKKDVRLAGWLYLIAAHVGAAFLVILFLLLGRHAGSFDFDRFMVIGPSLRPALAVAVFVLALVGFGTKAGLVPFHIWLPEAHPAAPSHVSALMSAVMIKIGIYGILRMMMILGHPAAWWGPVLVGVGLAGAVIGVSTALFQRDIKRALAYSSIENIGLIVLALGVGLWGLARGQMTVAMLGLAGGLLHIWNHSLMKGLMFLGAGSVLHGAGSKDMERLGGLLKRMPATGFAIVIGALALSAVPPLNGFVSEWLLYLSFLSAGGASSGFSQVMLLLAVGVLALIGGLALICFVRLIGIVLLGTARSEGACNAHESSRLMTVPMAILALGCILSALFPGVLISLMSGAVESAFGVPAATFLSRLESPSSPLALLGAMNALVWLGIGGVAVLLVMALRARRVVPGETWGCGYMAPTSRIQYTGQSFSELMVSRLFPRAWRPKFSVVSPEGLFPSAGRMTTDYPDTLSRLLYQPFFTWSMNRLVRFRWMQQGKIQYYMMYFVVVLLTAFAWLAVWKWILHD